MYAWKKLTGWEVEMGDGKALMSEAGAICSFFLPRAPFTRYNVVFVKCLLNE